MLPKSPLSKAIEYGLKHWKGLYELLKGGRIEIETNFD
ncbi:IS66 family transposase [Microbulbifer variabilis]